MTTRTSRLRRPLEVGMTHSSLVRCLRFAVITAAAAFASAAGAQTIDPNNEGYDPMRQISTQFVRPNVLLVFDVSGSMAWDEISGHTVGTDEDGSWLTATWGTPVGSGSCSGSGANRKCPKWTATLTVRQTHPSRMAKVKNALGNSMTIITPWTPPGGTCTDSSRQWPTLSSAWTGATGPTPRANDPNTSNAYWEYQWTWAKTTVRRC